MTSFAMPKPADSLSRAVAYQERGKLRDAARLCSGILKAEPDHFDAKHLLAIVLHQQGRTDEAIECLSAAVGKKPNSASALSNYGLMLHAVGRHEEALTSLQRALALRPGFAEAHNNRGSSLTALRRYQEALASYEQALAIIPNYVEALHNRGSVLETLGRYAEALASYDRVLALVPHHSETDYRRGVVLARLGRHAEALGVFDRAFQMRPNDAEVLNNRGVSLAALERHEEALTSFCKSLAVDPDYAQAYYNRALTLDALKRPEEALSDCERALALDPTYVEAHNNRGILLDELGRHEEALANYDRALALRPDYAEALNNRGTALIELARFEYALASYDAALALAPDYVEGRWNRSLLLLRCGDFERGWQEYEWRRRRDAWDPRNFAGAEWTAGSDAKRVLVYAEQGLGDTIQFARFAQSLAERGKEVVLEMQPPLGRLMSSLAGVTVVRRGEPLPGFDAHIPLMSLPHALGTTLANLPAKTPYLVAEPALVERWAARLPPDRSLRVGIACQGNPAAPFDKVRSFPLSTFAPLARIADVTLLSLQKHHRIEQPGDLPHGMKIVTLGDDFDSPPDAFVDTAAIMMSLDLVITGDTALAHLAGALGRPVWIAIRLVPDWRFVAGRDDMPWYPTARLFRQSRRGDWEEVFARMASELARLAEVKKSVR
jgi:tetratricopeptide (TPR) repeat protein